MQRSGHLGQLVDMYLAHDLVGEVIIINNASEPLPLAHPKLRVLQQESNIYVNPAWNLGAKSAREDLLIISNDDIWFRPRLIDYVELILRWPVGIVGPSWSTINRPLDSFPRYVPAYHLPHGFGTLMFMHRESYIPIPEELLILGGDDWLFEHQVNRNLLILGTRIGTEWSLTSALPEFIPIKQRDRELFAAKYHSTQYTRRYRLEASAFGYAKRLRFLIGDLRTRACK